MNQICLYLIAFVVMVLSPWLPDDPDDQLRTWKSSTGSYEVQATLVSSTDSDVVLKKADGEEVTVPLAKLSEADQGYLRKWERKSRSSNEENEALKRMASRFYQSLKTEDRADAMSLLTDDARKLATEKKSVLAKLPKPDEGARSLRLGKVQVDGNDAEVAVTVKAGGEQFKTTLHFSRREADPWKVFAISAQLGSDELTLNFETPLEPSGGTAPSKNKIAELLGKPVQLTGLTLEGSHISLEQYRGKVVLIDFWATWCGPCRAEIPNILANYEKYHDRGFDVLAVSVDKDLEKLSKFVSAEEPPWTVLADRHPDNKTSMGAAFGVRGIPAFLLVDPDGIVVDVDCRGPKLGKKLAEIFGS